LGNVTEFNTTQQTGDFMRSVDDYMEYFAGLGEEAQRKRLAAVKTILADLEQERIDAIAGDLLADMDLFQGDTTND
jgi:hypothetical protein